MSVHARTTWLRFRVTVASAWGGDSSSASIKARRRRANAFVYAALSRLRCPLHDLKDPSGQHSTGSVGIEWRKKSHMHVFSKTDQLKWKVSSSSSFHSSNDNYHHWYLGKVKWWPSYSVTGWSERWSARVVWIFFFSPDITERKLLENLQQTL